MCDATTVDRSTKAGLQNYTMKQLLSTLFLLIMGFVINAQELYMFSEPASNMPAKSLTVDLNWRSPVSKSNNYFKQRFMPELHFGVSKKLMLMASTTFSDFYSNQQRWESVKGYAKWRFFSQDDIHSHFRMAAFAEAAYTRNPFIYDELNLDGDNDGVQAGIVATKLQHKLAVSATVGVLKAIANRNKHVHGEGHSLEALNYSLAAGYLLFPKSYESYKQTNLNLYFELIGMRGLGGRDYMLDAAPALQLIFNSNFKINVGARFQLAGNMIRVGENNYFITLERTFLNAFK